MTSEDDRRIADIFEQAVDLPLAERGEFIDRACGGQVTVRREVEALLALDAEVDAGGGSPMWSSSAAAPSGALDRTERIRCHVFPERSFGLRSAGDGSG